MRDQPPADQPPADSVPALRPLTGELLLAAWEAGGRARPEPRRALALLAAALPATDTRALAALPLAERDRWLLRLRELTFGPDIAVFAGCPECGEQLEFSLPTAELAGQLAAVLGAFAAAPPEWDEDGARCRLRLATSDDLIAVLGLSDPVSGQSALLARCLTTDSGTAERVQLTPGPPPLPPSAAKRFDALHADTELRCGLDCPACSGHQVWELDIARFFWREVDVAARRLLAEVHTLAAAYGWTERDILRLSPLRRTVYLDLAAG
jgi:hypothetical protein